MKETTNHLLENICERMIRGKKTNKQPLCILIGGLPGSGKTNLVKKIINEYNDRDFLVIDADDYRKWYLKFHSQFQEKLLKTPELAIEETIKFANEIESELIKKGIESGCDIISVTSLRATDAVDQILYKPAIDSGYKVEAHIMSVPVRECGLSAQNRYEEQIENKKFPRFTPMEFIEGAYNGIRNTILNLQRKSEKTVIKIYGRGKGADSMPIESYNSASNNKIFSSSLEAFMNPKSSLTKESASNQIKELYEKKEQRGANKEEYKALKRLEELFEIENQER